MTTLPLPDQLYVKRKLRGLSQETVAKIAGIAVNTYCGAETGDGNPTRETLEKIAAALGCELTLKPKGSEER